MFEFAQYILNDINMGPIIKEKTSINISNKNLCKYAMVLIVFWILSPLYIMVFNFFKIDVHTMYDFWSYVLTFTGGFGLIVGGLYLYNAFYKSTAPDKLKISIPLILVLAFIIWALASTINSESKWLALTGYDTARATFPVFCFYAGMMFNGLTLASDSKRLKRVVHIFLLVATILAILALMNNHITEMLCENEMTDCPAYTSVFFNTNHYAYYILISILICAYTFLYSKNNFEKVIASGLLILFVNLLVLNDTMGSYLAALLTLIFTIVWSFINHETDKKGPFELLLLFLVATLITCFYTDNVLRNFVSMFSDFSFLSKYLLGDESLLLEASAAGSGRGELWLQGIDIIKQHPILGVGPQNIGIDVHNLFIQIAMYIGIPGLLIYIAFLISGVLRLIHNRKGISLIVKASAFIVVGYLISSFFGVVVFYTEPYFYIVLGVCLSGILKPVIDDDGVLYE